MIRVFVFNILTRFLMLCGRCFRKAPKNIEKNAEAVYGLKRATHFSKMFSKQVIQSHIQIFLESIFVVITRKEISISNRDDFLKVLSDQMQGGRGLVVAAAHHGSWELLAREVAKVLREPFFVLAKKSGVKLLDGFVAWFRRQSNCTVLWNHEASTIKTVLSGLKNGRAAGFVMDQRPIGAEGVATSFLGMDAEFVRGPAHVASKTGSALIAVSLLRTGFLKYRFEFEVHSPEPRAGVEQVDKKTIACVQFFAKTIRLYPEQWCWEYRRWRSVEIDKKLSSKIINSR